MKKDIKTYSNKIFARNFETFMFTKKLTLKDISEKTSLPLSTISTWRRGRIPRDPQALKKILKVFRVSRKKMLGAEIEQPEIFANEAPHYSKDESLQDLIFSHIKKLSAEKSSRLKLKKILAMLKKDFPLKNK